jgi:cyclopropane fatty-acyl-phospholipid synthase-like methyltransferase
MFTERSREKELLDLGSNYYTELEYNDCLEKLFRINKLLGFFQDTVKQLHDCKSHATVLDIGCGDGLFLLHLSQFFPDMVMLGTDISHAAIINAQHSLQIWQKKLLSKNVSFNVQDKNTFPYDKNSVDIILATLVCHHLDEDELIHFLQRTYRAARSTVIINDLQRHRVAYWFYRFTSPWVFRNRLITHDGLISILRGFTRKEWKLLLQKAGIPHYQLKWRFPFRWQLILRKK